MNFLTNITRSKGDPKVIHSGPSSFSASDRLARNLGWFSIGLGLVEIFGAHRLARGLGMRGHEGMIRAFGMREIGSGILSLSVDKQAGLMSRIAGDGLDIVTLLSAMTPYNRKRGNVGAALAMVLGVTVLDVIATQANNSRHARPKGPVRDYSDRSGFPKGIQAVRGLALKLTEGGKREDLAKAPNG